MEDEKFFQEHGSVLKTNYGIATSFENGVGGGGESVGQGTMMMMMMQEQSQAAVTTSTVSRSCAEPAHCMDHCADKQMKLIKS